MAVRAAPLALRSYESCHGPLVAQDAASAVSAAARLAPSASSRGGGRATPPCMGALAQHEDAERANAVKLMRSALAEAGEASSLNVDVAAGRVSPVAYTHLRAHESVLELVCRLLLEKKTL